jgi:hypothetical protein
MNIPVRYLYETVSWEISPPDHGDVAEGQFHHITWFRSVVLRLVWGQVSFLFPAMAGKGTSVIAGRVCAANSYRSRREISVIELQRWSD